LFFLRTPSRPRVVFIPPRLDYRPFCGRQVSNHPGVAARYHPPPRGGGIFWRPPNMAAAARPQHPPPPWCVAPKFSNHTRRGFPGPGVPPPPPSPPFFNPPPPISPPRVKPLNFRVEFPLKSPSSKSAPHFNRESPFFNSGFLNTKEAPLGTVWNPGFTHNTFLHTPFWFGPPGLKLGCPTTPLGKEEPPTQVC